MSLKTIQQIQTKVEAIADLPKNLRLINAYIDQALMNFNYETMSRAEIKKAFSIYVSMVDKYTRIRGL